MGPAGIIFSTGVTLGALYLAARENNAKLNVAAPAAKREIEAAKREIEASRRQDQERMHEFIRVSGVNTTSYFPSFFLSSSFLSFSSFFAFFFFFSFVSFFLCGPCLLFFLLSCVGLYLPQPALIFKFLS